jgi:hypothetical protein
MLICVVASELWSFFSEPITAVIFSDYNWGCRGRFGSGGCYILVNNLMDWIQCLVVAICCHIPLFLVLYIFLKHEQIEGIF